MAFADILYPGNPKKRREITTKMQRVYVLMEENFRATDDLITFLNANVSPSPCISQIQVDQNATFGVNAQTLIDKIKEVQSEVDKIDKTLSKELDPTVYEQLTSNNTNFRQKLKIFKDIKTGISLTETVATTITALLLGNEVVFAARIVAVIAGLSEILFATFAGVVVGVFVAGAAIVVDTLISAIFGAVERSKLNHLLEEIDGVLAKFEEPSKEYTRKIYEVLGVLRYLLGQPL